MNTLVKSTAIALLFPPLSALAQIAVNAPSGFTPGAWINLKLHAAGNSLNVYLDGKLIVAAIDDTFVDGGVALFTANARGEFDDLVATAS